MVVLMAGVGPSSVRIVETALRAWSSTVSSSPCQGEGRGIEARRPRSEI